MIIACVQMESIPGDIPSNVQRHIKAVQLAANAGAELVAFPELSITGYEPTLAKSLVIRDAEEQLNDLFSLSKQLGVTTAVGIPTPGDDKPRISQLFIFPDGTSGCYSKQILHDDEKPYFSQGENGYSLNKDNEVVIPAICYESLFPEHVERAAAQGATVYLACVAKPQPGKHYAHSHFPKAAKKHGFVVAMCNAVGTSDSFISAGSSAAWSRKGEKMAELDSQSEGILIVDVAGEEAVQISITAWD
ncbi:MAG: carbon-nitrogen hydrolase family protein [Pseudomonadaceae bacterium]|nr:carbon-nitrogen hydrolase family protein [Pseudomonadaceae bacterium]